MAHPDLTLWRSKLDGSSRTQLTYAPMQAAHTALVAGWNADRIYGIAPGKPWKIFVIPAEGGTPREVIPADHNQRDRNQGDPSWMPGGDSVVFAGIPWLEYGTANGPNIHIVDLKTAQVSDVPGSENLFSPRCSPDGRYVAALSADSTKLMLYDDAEEKLDAAGGVAVWFRELVARWQVSLCRRLFRQKR